MAEPALDLVPDDSDANCLAHDETRTCRGNTFPRPVRVRCTAAKMNDKERAPGPASPAYRGRKVLAPPQPMLGRQHVMDLGSGCSGRQTGATLATAGRENRAAGTGPHAQTEAVGLRAAAVVRLEGALAHSGAPGMLVVSRRDRCGASTGCHRAPTSSSQRLSAPLHDHSSVIFAHRRQAAAAIDNSTWSRYARLRHPVKPAPRQPLSAPRRDTLCTACGQQLEYPGPP